MTQYRLDYVLQKQHELEDATSEIEELRSRAARDEADKASHSIQPDHLIQSMELQVLEAQTKLEKLKEAGESAWESLKAGLETSLGKLKTSLKDFASQDS